MGNWAEEALGDLYRLGGAYWEAANQDTWGHLAPQKNTTYRGHILTCKSGYGGIDGKIIDMEWDKLGDSPWLFDHVDDYIWKIRDQMKDDGVYLIETTFRNYRMWSKVQKITSLEMIKKMKNEQQRETKRQPKSTGDIPQMERR